MKYLFGIVLLLSISCGNKEDILLPKADRTIVKEVVDLSSIYIFFRVRGKDTLAEVNRKNSIITTNWILNIDKRLPLRLVIPEVIKLQQRKREEKEHRNELAQNYYSYADSIGKNLAFIPFTNVYYMTEKPKNGTVVFFTKDGVIMVNNELVSKNDFQKVISNSNGKLKKIRYCFDKNCNYGSYIQNKVLIHSVELKNVISEEFVY
ncbi:hypothetical protein C8C85_3208 [Flavobacterium sp. 103]|uniref:hypothetical protein n=1 Tax=Flavobacterium sp. 103 TaxID=2135624 RepID=UPI000D5E7EA0|nr:hypothetical protein [Flavobacterium sp. 103]PVX47276.1 hypothetical protein C8C85_3208 [Flavobacterium sp. 103]